MSTIINKIKRFFCCAKKSDFDWLNNIKYLDDKDLIGKDINSKKVKDLLKTQRSVTTSRENEDKLHDAVYVFGRLNLVLNSQDIIIRAFYG